MASIDPMDVPQIQQLTTLRSVIATGSVRAAAEALGYSPSAVSHQLAQLHTSTGVLLLRKVGRGVEPTAEGVALAARADVLLSEMADVDEFVRALRAGRSTRLTIGYFSSLGPTWIPRIVVPLSDEFPGTSLELFVADAYEPARRPTPDLQFVVRPEGTAPPSGYRVEPLVRDPFVVVLPAGHPLTAREQVPLPVLADHDWIDNEPSHGSCWQVVARACASAGIRPCYRIQAPDYSSAVALVAGGLGISVMPAVATQSLPPGVEWRPLTDPTPVRTIQTLVSTSVANRPAVRRAVELARLVARQGAAPRVEGAPTPHPVHDLAAALPGAAVSAGQR